MKYIDAEKLITIIEERKAQQDQWINRYHDPINQGISHELNEILSIIATLKQEQPSLPSNLDEAAHEFEDKALSDYDNIRATEDGEERPVLKYNFTDAFKAGAEWMAGQGETFNGYISIKGKRSLIAIEGKSDICKFGEKVIVQIRRNSCEIH